MQVLAERMDYWNHDPGADAINRVRGAVADVKSVMIENIEKVRAHNAPKLQLMHLPKTLSAFHSCGPHCNTDVLLRL